MRPVTLSTPSSVGRTQLALFLLVLTGVCFSVAGQWVQYSDTRYVTSQALYRDTLWVGTRGGVAWIDLASDGGGLYNSANAGLPLVEVKGVAVDSSGHVWALAGWRLVRLDRDSCMVVGPGALGLPSLSVNVVAVSPSGEVWLGGTGDEVGVFDGNRWELRKPRTLSGAHVLAVTFDTKGTGWIGTGERGVQYWTGDTWVALDTMQAGRKIAALAPAREGGLWIYSIDKGLVRLSVGGCYVSCVDVSQEVKRATGLWLLHPPQYCYGGGLASPAKPA